MCRTDLPAQPSVMKILIARPDAPFLGFCSDTYRPKIPKSGMASRAIRIGAGLALFALPITASAGHGPGMDFLVAVTFCFYAALCVVSVTISLWLRCSVSRRFAFGLGAPLIGMGSGVAWSYVRPNSGIAPFVVLSVLPIIVLLIAVLYQVVEERVRHVMENRHRESGRK